MINAEMLFLSFDARETDDEQAAHEQVLVEQLLNPNLHQRQLQSASVTALLNLTPNPENLASTLRYNSNQNSFATPQRSRYE